MYIFLLNNFSPKTCFGLFLINQMDPDKDYVLELLVSRYIDIMSVMLCETVYPLHDISVGRRQRYDCHGVGFEKRPQLTSNRLNNLKNRNLHFPGAHM